MARRRLLRVARVIKEAVSRAIIEELADPRVGFVTVTEVEVSPDMRTALVKLSVLGEPGQARRCLDAVNSARGRLQQAVGDEMTAKVTPRLSFELDDSVKKSVELSRLMRKARSEYRRPEPGQEGASEDSASAEESSE